MGDFIWIFFLLLFMQPLLNQRWREYTRLRLIRRIETRRDSRVILLVHRQETMSLLGIPLMRYIDIDDSEKVLRAIRETDPDQSIDFVLHTPGGVALAALQIARALKTWPGEVRVLVPHYAMSGGTLIAFAADHICMTEHAVLGPLDPQVAGYPAASVMSVLERKPIENIEDETLIIADVAQRAMKQMHDNIIDLLSDRYPVDQATQIAELFTDSEWTHDRPISQKDLRGLGFDVDADVPDDILELMSLYMPAARGTKTVEYLPRRP